MSNKFNKTQNKDSDTRKLLCKFVKYFVDIYIFKALSYLVLKYCSWVRFYLLCEFVKHFVFIFLRCWGAQWYSG